MNKIFDTYNQLVAWGWSQVVEHLAWIETQRWRKHSLKTYMQPLARKTIEACYLVLAST
jgi:hypothetical protein